MTQPTSGDKYILSSSSLVVQKQRQQPTKHVLVLGLEFVDPLFSGNGVMTRTLIRSLLLQNDALHVTVLCARPSDNTHDHEENNQNHIQTDAGLKDAIEQSRLQICSVAVPSSQWKRLDRYSAWKTMAQGAPQALQKQTKGASCFFDFLFMVDWTAFATYHALVKEQVLITEQKDTTTRSTKLFSFVFRVFSNSTELWNKSRKNSHNCRSRKTVVAEDDSSSSQDSTACKDFSKDLSDESMDDETFYQIWEVQAMVHSHATVVLSHVDRSSLRVLFRSSPLAGENAEPKFYILMPPLREEMLHLVQQQHQQQQRESASPIVTSTPQEKKQYLLCSVRLSPEKNALLFAQITRRLSQSHNNLFSQLHITPLLIGASCDPEYTSKVHSSSAQELQCIHNFVTPQEMVHYLQQTVLLIHPPVYDAYGMIVAEAAGVGVPSLIHCENVGVASLLQAGTEEVFVADFTKVEAVEEKVRELLLWEDKLKKVGEKARMKSLEWTTEAYAVGLRGCMDELSVDE